MPLSALTASRDASDKITYLDKANIAQLIGVQTTLSALTYACIKSAANLQDLICRHGPRLFALLKDIPAWVRANPYEFAAILGGSTVFVLSCATPVILGAMGFSAVGPVAGSIAAGWQASLGSVVSGSLFSFLQGAAMGGAAMGVFTGIGAAGVGVAAAGVLVAVRGKVAGLLGKVSSWGWKGKKD